jgi:hypothetical protein
MNLLMEATSGLGAALLPVAAALLFEELTCGGLARLLIVPWPRSYKHGGASDGPSDEKTARQSQTTKPNKQDGERK